MGMSDINWNQVNYMPTHSTAKSNTLDVSNDTLGGQQALSAEEQECSNQFINAQSPSEQKDAVTKLLNFEKNNTGDQATHLYNIFESIRNESPTQANAFSADVISLNGGQISPKALKNFADVTHTTVEADSPNKTDSAHEHGKEMLGKLGEGAHIHAEEGTGGGKLVGLHVIAGLAKRLAPGLIYSDSGEGMNNCDIIQQAASDTATGVAHAVLVKAFGPVAHMFGGKTAIGATLEGVSAGITNKKYGDSKNPALRSFGLSNTGKAIIKAGASTAAFLGAEVGLNALAPGVGGVAGYGAAMGAASGASELVDVAFDKLGAGDKEKFNVSVMKDFFSMCGISFSADVKGTEKAPYGDTYIPEMALMMENNPALMQALRDSGIDSIHMDNIYALTPNMVMNMVSEAKEQGGTSSIMRYLSGGNDKGINVNVTTAGVERYSDPRSSGTVTTHTLEVGARKSNYYTVNEDKAETKQRSFDELNQKVVEYQANESGAFNTVDADTQKYLDGLKQAF